MRVPLPELAPRVLDRGGSCRPERFPVRREATITGGDAENPENGIDDRGQGDHLPGGQEGAGPPGRAASVMRPGRISAYTTPQATFVARHGSRGGRAPVSSGWTSAVTLASSAYVRDTYTWSTRASSSSSVSRPCTNSALRISITCSRSAWDSRGGDHRASAFYGCGSPGPLITAPPLGNQRDEAKCNAVGRLLAIPHGG